MAEYRADFGDLLDPSFRAAYHETERQITPIGQTIFRNRTSDRNQEKRTSISGLSKMVRTAEGAPITYEDRNQGYDVTYSHFKDTLGATITREMWEDDQFDVINEIPIDLARAKMRTKEQLMADILNNATTAGGGGSAPFTGGDAKALLATDHPRTDGGTAQSNYTTADLAEDSLETAEVTMRATLDNKGQLMSMMPDTLIVPPTLANEARILLDSTGRVGTANNDTNPYSGKFRLVVWDYLGSAAGGSDTAWFLVDSGFHKLAYYNRSDLGLEGPDTDFDTKNARWSIVCRWSVGFDDWRGFYGSAGDNS